MYYPKSQIKTNLYTNGGEYVVKATNINYVGYYYELSNGKKYVGKSPASLGEIEIILPPLISPEDITYNPKYVRLATWEGDPDPEMDMVYDPVLFNTITLYNYSNLPKNSSDQPRLVPPPYYSIPTEEEEEIGEYRRYFAKKNNELIYIEISEETYNKFINKDPKVAFDLYNCLFLPWSINDAEVNQNIISLIERNNNYFGFSSYFQGNFG